MSTSLKIDTSKVQGQEKHRSQEIDIILELLIDVGDGYFFGMDEFKDILSSQQSKNHPSFY